MVSRFLVLDASPAGDAARGLAACLEQRDRALNLVSQCEEAGKQAAEGINLLAARALDQAGWQGSAAPAPDCVAVVIGPGSFTGLRASCAVAAGYALGVGAELVGVSRAEALAPALDAELTRHEGLAGWLLVTSARRGRVFVEDNQGGLRAISVADWQPPPGRWLVAGDAAEALTFNEPVRSTASAPDPEQIARAALRRLTGELPPRQALPLYVDPPEAKLPADGLRAAPV
ncbi:MAG: tRNA (adenosine(37)-N6)-threonylcarbamoyltransferase complex dimerization subunit type 1 TsaB [Acetobacter sp.]|uniref:tRNA (adenosine(37)-N6)-threonylcarbamoyltransferase complex dimerization subunit type 1 TsaB n=1 Tax=Acetobacter sp. TaxID=440 RepID=UPI003D0127B0